MGWQPSPLYFYGGAAEHGNARGMSWCPSFQRSQEENLQYWTNLHLNLSICLISVHPQVEMWAPRRALQRWDARGPSQITRGSSSALLSASPFTHLITLDLLHLNLCPHLHF